MRHSTIGRLISLAIALLGSLSAPMLAVAHGHVHEHVAMHHGVGDAADVAVEHGRSHEANGAASHHAEHPDIAGSIGLGHLSIVPSSTGEHAHEHPTLDVVPAGRDLNRVPAAPHVVAIVPALVTPSATLLAMRGSAPTDSSQLARPGPERGPPPTVRAPPIS